MYAPALEMVPPVAEYATETFTLSPVFLRPYAKNCWTPPTDNAVFSGLMTSWMILRFFTLEVPVTVELESVALTTASVADVSAV
jgi:hypothetical protein